MILSVCIPSFNRFQTLWVTINSILKAKSNDFEVVVVDNCSPGNIYDYLNFNDKRLKIIKRKEAVTGRVNCASSIYEGNGHFSMLLLDKDTIDGYKLDSFILFLNTNKENISGGYVKLDLERDSSDLIDKNPAIRFAYNENHPSGFFFLSSYIKKFTYSEAHNLINNPFAMSFLMAECSCIGNMAIYCHRLIVTAQLNCIPGSKTASYSYSNEKGNIYVMPKNRIAQMELYVIHMKTLNTSLVNKIFILSSILEKKLIQCSYRYVSLMNNPEFCEHYGLSMREVGNDEVKKYVKALVSAYFKCTKGIKFRSFSFFMAIVKYQIRRIVHLLKQMWIRGGFR